VGSDRRVLSTAQGTHTAAFGGEEWGLIAAGALIWGSSFLLIAISVEDLAPGVVALLRLVFGVAVVAAFPGARRAIARADWPRVAFLALVWMTIPFVLFPIAEQWVASSLAGIINAAMPIFTAVIAVALLGRVPRAIIALGLGVGFLGVVVVSWPSLQAGSSTALGVVLLLIAVACYGLAANVTVPLQQRYGSLAVLLWVELAAIAFTLPVAAVGVPSSDFTWHALGAVVLLGAFGTGLAFVAIVRLLGRVGATRASIVTYFFPVVAIALGAAFRDEAITTAAVVGTALILVGAWLSGRREG
jgi:drug/metabolite transporter (DMT)-like permease